MISTERFCLNRKVAPGIKLEQTVSILKELGIPNIELRNDLYGSPDDSTILDGLNSDDAKDLFKSNRINIETINAIGNMDKRSLIDENISSLKEMLEMTKGMDLKNIVFCPVRSSTETRNPDQVKIEAIANVKEYSNVLKEYNVNGLIEPLGFTDSTIRTPWQAQEIIKESGVDNFKLVADTFHYYLANVTLEQFKELVDLNYVGLVHLSSVFANKKRDDLDDQDRYMLGGDDIMKSAELAQMFESSGYRGLYAFEPFSDDLKDWNEIKVKNELQQSIEMVCNAENELV